jgi:hypothetical protein
MKKLIGLALAVALFAGTAQAAEINLIQRTAIDTAADPTLWDLSIQIPENVQVGAIAFLVDRAQGFTFNPALVGTVISIADSVNAQDGTARHVAGNGLTLGQVLFQGPNLGTPLGLVNGVPMTGILIGTFNVAALAGCSPSNLAACPQFLSSVPDGGSIQDLDFGEIPSNSHVIPAPEPMTAVLLGFGLASIALVRRKA